MRDQASWCARPQKPQYASRTKVHVQGTVSHAQMWFKKLALQVAGLLVLSSLKHHKPLSQHAWRTAWCLHALKSKIEHCQAGQVSRGRVTADRCWKTKLSTSVDSVSHLIRRCCGRQRNHSPCEMQGQMKLCLSHGTDHGTVCTTSQRMLICLQ